MRSKVILKVVAAIVVGLISVDSARSQSSPSAISTAADLRQLPPEEKNALLQKKERFDALQQAEQQRLRELNAQIAASEHANQLHATLDRYHEWLKTLTTKQRADLLELPADQKIVRIKELMKEQERSRLRELGGQKLPEADVDAIFTWLDNFVQEHEDQFLNRLPDDMQEKLKNQDAVARRRSLMRGIVMRGPRNDAPLPTGEYLDQLMSKLTPATRAALESAKTPEEKQQLARQWIFAAMFSKVFPPASEEDLRKVYDELPSEHRERLDRKSPEDVKRELTWRFHMKQWPAREGGWRGPGGPGFGPPGGFRPNGPGNGGPSVPDRRGPDRRDPDRRDPSEDRPPSKPAE